MDLNLIIYIILGLGAVICAILAFRSGFRMFPIGSPFGILTFILKMVLGLGLLYLGAILFMMVGCNARFLGLENTICPVYEQWNVFHFSF